MTRVEFSQYLVCKSQPPKNCDLDQQITVNLITVLIVSCYKRKRTDRLTSTEIQRLIELRGFTAIGFRQVFPMICSL
jgi:hypothetical protein